MTKSSRSSKRRQCSKCPWKVGTNPRDIPNGYCEQAHRDLNVTIASDASFGTRIKIMACHETRVGKELPCVGWLANQLGPGNNIGLRLAVMRGAYRCQFPDHRSSA